MSSTKTAKPIDEIEQITFLITGASRGLGQAIAIVATNYFLNCYKRNDDETDMISSRVELRFVLVARSIDGLQETKQSIMKECDGNVKRNNASDDVNYNDSMGFNSTQQGICISCHAMDLSNLDQLDSNLDVILKDVFASVNIGNKQLCPHKRKRYYFINNAGSLGHIGSCITSPSLQDMRYTVDFNMTSCFWSTIRFAKHAIATWQQQQQQQQQQVRDTVVIVNMSSLVAISDDFLTMGIYSAGKGARDKYHTILAKELVKSISDASTKEATTTLPSSPIYPFIKILNYAPGPLETEMTQQLRAHDSLDKDLKPNFQKRLLDVKDSAKKLIQLIDANDFESGVHIDYYDLP